jgi:hypothetical protein
MAVLQRRCFSSDPFLRYPCCPGKERDTNSFCPLDHRGQLRLPNGRHDGLKFYHWLWYDVDEVYLEPRCRFTNTFARIARHTLRRSFSTRRRRLPARSARGGRTLSSFPFSAPRMAPATAQRRSHPAGFLAEEAVAAAVAAAATDGHVAAPVAQASACGPFPSMSEIASEASCPSIVRNNLRSCALAG